MADGTLAKAEAADLGRPTCPPGRSKPLRLLEPLLASAGVDDSPSRPPTAKRQ